jgi:hypothetical protein
MEYPNNGTLETVSNQKTWIFYYSRKPNLQAIWQKKHSKYVGGIVTSPILNPRGW